MNLDEFERLAAAYGSDLARWPDAVRAEARLLTVVEPKAQAALLRAAELDALLVDANLPVDIGSVERSVSRTLRRTRATPPPRAWRWLPVAVLLGAALAGCAAGLESSRWLDIDSTEPASSALAALFDLDASRF